MPPPRDPSDGPPEGRPASAPSGIDPEAPDLLERLGIVVPDDARALDALAEQLRRRDRPTPQPRWSARPRPRSRSRSRLHPLDPRHAADRLRQRVSGMAVPSLLAVGLVLIAAMLASLMTVLSPVVTMPTDARPALAADPAALLPPGDVVVDGERTSTRDLRPTALLVLDDPTGCTECVTTLSALVAQALTFGVPAGVVVSAEARGAGQELVDQVDSAQLVVDTEGVLTARYGTTQPLVALVHADGVARDPVSPADPALGAQLAVLTGPGTTGG